MAAKFEVRLAESARRALKAVPLPWRERIKNTIDMLEENPCLGEKIWGRLWGKRKIRIWPYRILYRVREQEKIVEILKIDLQGGSGKVC